MSGSLTAVEANPVPAFQYPDIVRVRDLVGRRGQVRLSGSQTKGKRARTLPIFGEMKEWLVFQLDKRNEKWPDLPWVFNWTSKPIGAQLKGWSKACEATGLHFHDLRRSAVRNLERAGVPRRVAMEIAGHRTEAIYRRYDIVNQADLSRAGPMGRRSSRRCVAGRSSSPVVEHSGIVFTSDHR